METACVFSLESKRLGGDLEGVDGGGTKGSEKE
jgi:hypothetical protein